MVERRNVAYIHLFPGLHMGPVVRVQPLSTHPVPRTAMWQRSLNGTLLHNYFECPPRHRIAGATAFMAHLPLVDMSADFARSESQYDVWHLHYSCPTIILDRAKPSDDGQHGAGCQRGEPQPAIPVSSPA
jgi:hypothetical protein